MNLYAIAPLLSFILLIVGAYYLLSKGIRRISNWVFSIALFMLALAEFGNFMALVSLNPASALFWQKWVLVAFFFVAFCWMLLSLVFARGDSFALARRGWWYLAGLFIFAIWFFSRLPRASLIADAGWSKEDIREFVYEKARISMTESEAAGILVKVGEWVERLATITDKSTLVPMTERPEDLVIVVAGGAPSDNSTFIPCIMRKVTGEIDRYKPANWQGLIKKAREELLY